ncbi:helix-turn-helix domain-containing protein [Ktedonosporobacter rubrisoli]|uniref:Helix-turn-helix domain-containing protein n=1 Tax=Ktedonosporobacter rubrisoli TaxID=2509675 RepID=A0A4P6K1E9_KTERU|nr:helix-turn-helix domain-containing protein [Ktedonosporobacter rubrisoli]QBD81815.1 helix-turn-helix domain-containing protein [Ktedonosporobacter rubrisoli]
MKRYGAFLANLRNSADISQEKIATLVETSKSTISRLENDEIPLPFKGTMRKTVLALAEILCPSQRETERYLEMAGIERELLTESEEIQLGFMGRDMRGVQNEKADLERWEQIYTERLQHLEKLRVAPGISGLPPNMKRKMQEYANILTEIRRRLDRLYNRNNPIDLQATQTTQAHFTVTEEGRLVVGHQYSDGQFNGPLSSNLYALASPNARWLMQHANIERFAVDDCITLTRSRNFEGWAPDDVRTAAINTPLPIPDDLAEIKQKKLSEIEQHFFNSSHYRLVSYSPLLSYREYLEIRLSPIGFYDHYSLSPFFDEPLLTALDGSKISIRQKYGNTALTYSSSDKGTSLIPTPISLQCLVVTSDQQIVLMQRSSSVAFYPGHWSASFEKSMNAPGIDRKGRPSRSDDANFFAGAIRGLEEELGVPPAAVENIKVLSLNVEYLTLSVDVIIMIKVTLTGDEIKSNWILSAWDMDEASQFDLLAADLPSVIDKLFSKRLWHPTSRMRLLQYLFHTYGIDEVARVIKERQGQSS